MKNKEKFKEILIKLNESSATHDLIQSSEIKKRAQEVRQKIIENDIAENELTLKKVICNWVQWLVNLYLIFVASIILFLGLEIAKLNDSVIIALLTTTTINILGLPYMIIKSLFPSMKEKDK